jgi:endonuclease YncB( thermonuclease family)
LFQFHTVEYIPDSFFKQNKVIYGRVEQIVRGDTIRVMHVPGFSIANEAPLSPLEGSLETETLLIRLYGIEMPSSDDEGDDAMAQKAAEFVSDLALGKMVKITLLGKKQQHDDDATTTSIQAIAMVEMVQLKTLGVRNNKNEDLTIALAQAGLANVQKSDASIGGTAEEYKRGAIDQAIYHAKNMKRGMYSFSSSST